MRKKAWAQGAGKGGRAWIRGEAEPEALLWLALPGDTNRTSTARIERRRRVERGGLAARAQGPWRLCRRPAASGATCATCLRCRGPWCGTSVRPCAAAA